MRGSPLLIIVILISISCSKPDNNGLIDELANLEYQLDQFIVHDGVSINSEVFENDTLSVSKIVFSFSESHCLDCITKNLDVIHKMIDKKALKHSDIILVANFKDRRLFSSYISRFNLSKVNALFSEGRLIKTREGLFDQPTFFLLKNGSMTAHFIYQPTLYTTAFSNMYLHSISKNLKRLE